MQTYVYSKSRSMNHQSSSVPKYLTNESPDPKILRYKTTAPKFVDTRYIKQSNGGFRLQYTIKNAKITTNNKSGQKPFVFINKLSF